MKEKRKTKFNSRALLFSALFLSIPQTRCDVITVMIFLSIYTRTRSRLTKPCSLTLKSYIKLTVVMILLFSFSLSSYSMCSNHLVWCSRYFVNKRFVRFEFFYSFLFRIFVFFFSLIRITRQKRMRRNLVLLLFACALLSTLWK